jgi:hypothetical protein
MLPTLKPYGRGNPKLKHWATSPEFVIVENAKAKALAFLDVKEKSELWPIKHHRATCKEIVESY